MKLQTNKWYRLSFEEFKEISFHNPVKYSGLYAIFIEGICTYIGSSQNVFSRIKTHMKNANVFTLQNSKKELAIKLIEGKSFLYILELETKLINRIKPKGNIKFSRKSKKKKPVYLIDLIREFKEIVERKRMNLDEIAKEIGVCKLTIKNWLFGITKPHSFANRIIREFIERHR